MARILLADDDAATRDLVKRALEGDGHTVQVTQDGSEALESVKRTGAQKFDLLVSDVEMPLLDGVKLAERASALQPGLRVLLMSGFAEQLERAKTLNGPQVAVISKPFTLDQVRTTVRKLLG
jgi:two-component system, cell cycle response regulator CpdR